MKSSNVLICLFVLLAILGASAFSITKAARAFTEEPEEKSLEPSAPHFRHIFVVVLENDSAKDALKAPFLKKLTTMGGYLSNFRAIGHPSEPNYIAMIAGSRLGVNDDREHRLQASNLTDLLEAKNLTWKAYAENLPGPCQQRNGRLFAQRHVPFLSFSDIMNNRSRCANIVDAKRLAADIENDRLPHYAMYTPNLKNDGHDTGTRYADDWLRRTFGPWLDDPRFMKDTLFVVTFDEGDYHDPENHIYTVLYNPEYVKAGSVSDRRYDHMSLLKFIEDNFGLGDLGRGDASATAITGIFK